MKTEEEIQIVSYKQGKKQVIEIMSGMTVERIKLSEKKFGALVKFIKSNH